MSSSFSVDGLDKLIDKLSKLGKAGNGVGNKALKAGAKVIVAQQKLDAPRRTGTGANALKVGRIMTAQSKNKYVQIGIPDGATWMLAKGVYFQHHGFYNHWAKRYIAGSLWMDKSFEKSKDMASAAMLSTLERELDF